MINCPFCGGKIYADASECKHCGKTLSSKSQGRSSEPEKSSMASLESYKQKTVPSWMMYLLVGAALFCLWIMFAQGCEKVRKNKAEDESALVLPASIEQHFV